MRTETASATYSNDPSGNAIDALRLRVGDTDCSSAYLTDSEVRYFLATEASPVRAAAMAARAIAAKVAKKIDFSFDKVSKSASQLFDHYNALAEQLDDEASICNVAPIGLGQLVAEKQSANADTSRVQPAFARGMMDNPRSGDVSLDDPDLDGGV